MTKKATVALTILILALMSSTAFAQKWHKVAEHKTPHGELILELQDFDYFAELDLCESRCSELAAENEEDIDCYLSCEEKLGAQGIEARLVLKGQQLQLPLSYLLCEERDSTLQAVAGGRAEVFEIRVNCTSGEDYMETQVELFAVTLFDGVPKLVLEDEESITSNMGICTESDWYEFKVKDNELLIEAHSEVVFEGDEVEDLDWIREDCKEKHDTSNRKVALPTPPAPKK